jgi:hypothetical protein
VFEENPKSKHNVEFWDYRSHECELVYNIHGLYQQSALVFLLLKLWVLLAEILYLYLFRIPLIHKSLHNLHDELVICLM